MLTGYIIYTELVVTNDAVFYVAWGVNFQCLFLQIIFYILTHFLTLLHYHVSARQFLASQNTAHWPSLGLVFLIHVTMVWQIVCLTFQRRGHEVRKKLQNIVPSKHKNKSMAETEHFVSGVFSPLK